MKFNSFLWETYKNSTRGIELINLFSDMEKHYTNKNLKTKIIKLIKSIKLESSDNSYFNYIIKETIAIKKLIIKSFKPKIVKEKDASKLLKSIWNADIIEDDDENSQYEFEVDDIDLISSALYLINKEYYFPYFFSRQFYLIANIFNEFGIYLPPVPAKSDIKKRKQYYWELCKSLIDFRKKYNISGTELPAFLYGFAINVIPRYSISTELPAPRKAFFVGGGKNNNGDFEYLDKANKSTVYNWQGNPDTEPGDIIVMYCLSPRSYIHSIWRAVTPGTIDPFFCYYRNVYIGHPIRIKPISLEEIKNDTILKQMSLIKCNMQGINGRLIEKKYYDRILEILESKKQDISLLPKLENVDFDTTAKIKNERDVESYLLEPLLNKLGYNEKDWKRQLKVRMGRSEKVIPDYVLFPNEEKGNESGFWVLEAKYSINNHKQLKIDFEQAKSYALRLQCEGLCLVSKEGIWLGIKPFDFDKVQYWTWKQLEERDVFNDLYNIMRKKK